MQENVKIDEKLLDDICGYCKINNLDVSTYVTNIVRSGHLINKFGDLNDMVSKVSKPIEKVSKQKQKKDVVKEVCIDTIVSEKTNDVINVVEEPPVLKEENVVKVVKRKRKLAEI